jgi:hypothetical protein
MAWTPTNGASCGSGEVCNQAVCASGCFVAGAFYPAGKANPGNLCQSCQPGLATTAFSPDATMNGASCGSDVVCSDGQCGAGCFIGGAVYASGAVDAAQTCQGCVPASSTTAWTTLPDGTGCAAGSVCIQAACKAGCFIAGQFVGPGDLETTNDCQSCQPSASTTAWSSVADGTACAAGDVCVSGNCSAACNIGGQTYASGAPDPANACQTCQPSTSTTAWTPLATGASCGAGTVCNASGACVAGCGIGGSVYAPGAANASNACQSCQPGTSTAAWSSVPDGTTCSTGTCCAGSCSDESSDDQNCGACGAACPTGCLAGTCPATALASGLDAPTVMAVDANNVYWSDSAAGHAVMELPLGGDASAAIALAPAVSAAASDLAVTATNVYWADGSAVRAVPIAGGSTTTISAVGASSLALSATKLYWTTTSAILSAPLPSGTVSTIESGLTAPTNISLGSSHLYWASNPSVCGPGSILSCSLTGGAITTLASGSYSAYDTLAVGSSVYSLDFCGVPVTAGLFLTTSPTSTTSLSGLWVAGTSTGYVVTRQLLAADATHVYFVDTTNVFPTLPNQGFIRKIPLAGGPTTTIAAQQNFPVAIAVDSTYVYWVNHGQPGMNNGAVLRALK